MIGRLKGIVADKYPEGALIDVRGVGYEVHLPLSTLAALPPKGESVTLHIHTHAREDSLKLFGFESTQDVVAFRTMLRVNGVGPKLAVVIIGALAGAELVRVIEQSDVTRLCAIPGIGKKTAERIVLELSGKLKLQDGASKAGGSATLSDLTSALKNLGFKPARVEQALAKMQAEEKNTLPFEDLLKRALGLLQENR